MYTYFFIFFILRNKSVLLYLLIYVNVPFLILDRGRRPRVTAKCANPLQRVLSNLGRPPQPPQPDDVGSGRRTYVHSSQDSRPGTQLARLASAHPSSLAPARSLSQRRGRTAAAAAAAAAAARDEEREGEEPRQRPTTRFSKNILRGTAVGQEGLAAAVRLEV
jgi:hypothetical protein